MTSALSFLKDALEAHLLQFVNHCLFHGNGIKDTLNSDDAVMRSDRQISVLFQYLILLSFHFLKSLQLPIAFIGAEQPDRLHIRT